MASEHDVYSKLMYHDTCKRHIKRLLSSLFLLGLLMAMGLMFRKNDFCKLINKLSGAFVRSCENNGTNDIEVSLFWARYLFKKMLFW